MPLIATLALQIYSCNTCWSVSILHVGPVSQPTRPQPYSQPYEGLEIGRGRGAALPHVFGWCFCQNKSAGLKASLDRFNQIVVLHDKKVVLRLGPLPQNPRRGQKMLGHQPQERNCCQYSHGRLHVRCLLGKGKSNTPHPKRHSSTSSRTGPLEGQNQQQRFVC